MTSDVVTVPQHKKLNRVILRESVLNKKTSLFKINVTFWHAQPNGAQTETASRFQLKQEVKEAVTRFIENGKKIPTNLCSR